MNAGTGGGVSPSSAWNDSGTVVPINAGSAPAPPVATSSPPVPASSPPPVPVATLSTLSTLSTLATTAVTDDVWAKLRKCETGGRYDLNTGNGYYGAYQFAAKTWAKLGYAGLPHQAAPEVQDEAARKLLSKLGWGQWPSCSRKLGLR